MPSSKKIVFLQMGYLGPKMAHPHNSGSTVKIVFTILHNERVLEGHRNYTNDFLEKDLIQGNLVTFTPKWYLLNFGSALRFFLILRNKRGQELNEILLVVF